jgi:hypothetical protein
LFDDRHVDVRKPDPVLIEQFGKHIPDGMDATVRASFISGSAIVFGGHILS